MPKNRCKLTRSPLAEAVVATTVAVVSVRVSPCACTVRLLVTTPSLRTDVSCKVKGKTLHKTLFSSVHEEPWVGGVYVHGSVVFFFLYSGFRWLFTCSLPRCRKTLPKPEAPKKRTGRMRGSSVRSHFVPEHGQCFRKRGFHTRHLPLYTDRR